MNSEKQEIHSALFWCCTGLFVLFGAYQAYLTTAWGAGLTTDSLSYLQGARSILKNGDLSGLGSHWPPLYFLLISLSISLFQDPLAAIRWLQILTMAANVLLVAFVLYKATGRSLVASFTGTVVFITSKTVLWVHCMAWSEAFFCLLALAGVYFLAEYIREQEKIFLLVVSACFIGLAFVTRYVGITLIATGIAALLLWDRKKIFHRIGISIFFGFISSVPMLVWMIRNLLINQAATDRDFIFHPVPMQKIAFGLRLLSRWLFLPENSPILLLGVCFLLLAGYIYSLKILSGKEYDWNRMLEICFIFVVIYLGFILFSISFFDAHTPLDQRILYPVYVFFFVGVILLYDRLSKITQFNKLSIFIPILLLFISFKQYSGQQFFIYNAIENGLGFSSRQWVQSDILHWLKNIPPTTVIYTNGPDPITIYTDRKSIMIPLHTYPVNKKKNLKFDAEIDKMKEDLINNNGVIVYFYSITWRWYLPTLEELKKKMALNVVYQGKDGIAVSVHPPTVQDK
jgi:hypothetical protein